MPLQCCALRLYQLIYAIIDICYISQIFSGSSVSDYFCLHFKLKYYIIKETIYELIILAMPDSSIQTIYSKTKIY